ncbi:hypothetical protein EJB05_53645, partial [Eragrostis curvula]
MVISVVAQEAVSRIISCLFQDEGKVESNANENLERLEMAHIRLGAVLETSERWQVFDPSLLRWRRKLKHAAQECDDMLHKCKRRSLEDEQKKLELRNSSLPNWIATATKSFVSSIFNCDNNELSESIVRRFEWYADGASEFLRFIEIGGTPRCHRPFDSLLKNLFEGKQLHHTISKGNKHPLFQLWLVPYTISEHGTETILIIIQEDSTAPEGNIYFSIILQLSESTDIIGIAIKCLHLFVPHFKSPVQNIKRELAQLPAQDLSWVPSVDQFKKEHWDNLHNLGTQWFRPNPLCCKQHDRHAQCELQHDLDMAGVSDVSIEPVIEVNFQCQVSLSVQKKQLMTSLPEDKISTQASPHLKAGISFHPHGSSGAMLPVTKSSAITSIVDKEQDCMHTDITLEQLKDVILPRAIDYFRENSDATLYQMIWKSKHGCAFIQFEKASISSTRRTSMQTRGSNGGARKRKVLLGEYEELRRRTRMIAHLIQLWGAHAPPRVRRMLAAWVEKEKEIQLEAPQLQLKF